MAATLTIVPKSNDPLPVVEGYRVVMHFAEPGPGDSYLVARNEEPTHELVLTRYAAKTLSESPDLERFIAARRQLVHDRLPRFVDDGRLENGDRYIVVERPRGTSLATNTTLAPETVNSITLQICDGLRALHGAGFAHHSLTPACVVLDERFEVALIGFGAVTAASTESVLADVSAVGKIIEIACGTQLPARFTHIVARCVAGPADRYASVDELMVALKPQVATSREVDKPTPSAPTQRPPRDTREDSSPNEDAELAPPKAPGTVLGSYRLVDVLGEGGMGIVYHAEHVRLGRRVALKLLRGELSGDPLVVSRFFAEARAVNQICHENIVEITDFVENPSGDNYYIMEFLAGLNLKQAVEHDAGVNLSRSLGIAVQVCSALASVHEAGIVHRDLKPENIFLTERGGQKDFVKLLDFGIAKLGEKEAISTHKTGAGMIVGTPEYMSPEQASGIAVDHRSDIYALGLIIYELIAHKNPFDGANFGEMVVKRLSTTPPPPSTLAKQKVPAELDELVMHCIKMRREDRPSAIAEVETRLRAIAAAYDCDLETFVDAPAQAAPPKKKPLVPIVAAMGALAIAGAIVLFRPHSPPLVPIAAPAQIAPVIAPTPTTVVAPTPPAEIVDAPAGEPVAETRPGKKGAGGKIALSAHHHHKGKQALDGPGRHAVIDPFK